MLTDFSLDATARKRLTRDASGRFPFCHFSCQFPACREAKNGSLGVSLSSFKRTSEVHQTGAPYSMWPTMQPWNACIDQTTYATGTQTSSKPQAIPVVQSIWEGHRREAEGRRTQGVN